MADQYFTNTSIDIRIDTAPFDISTADSVLISYRRPNGTTGEWPATKFGSTVKYVTTPADIPSTAASVGTWKLQAIAIYGTVRKPGQFCYLRLDKPNT